MVLAAKVPAKSMNILMMRNTVNSVEVPVMVLALIALLKFTVMDMVLISVYGVAQHLLALVQKVLTKSMKNKE
jgi:hypothetical protein